MTTVGAYVVETLVTLLGVVVLAVLLLYGVRRLGVGRTSGPVQLVGRLPLEGRRAVYLVQIETTIHVIFASESSAIKLGELAATSPIESASIRNEPFASVMSRMLQRARGQSSTNPTSAMEPERKEKSGAGHG